VLPAVAKFTTGVSPVGVAVMPDISHYLDFALTLFIAFGVCFEVPVVLLILVAVGAVTPAQLASSRRYAIVAAFVVAAIFTPPDALSMLALAIPMCLLYELGIVAARVLTRPQP
jgi:sec-independent protein translocase protein TatC